MRKFDNYQFKKIYLDENIFLDDDSELKVGYFNINGLLDGGHAEYLNEDKNLRFLHILVLAETKLERRIQDSEIEKVLTNWIILCRHDAVDDSKHMGLILLCPKNTTIQDQLLSYRHQSSNRHDGLQMQGLIVRFKTSLSIGFVYCRSTPNEREVKRIQKCFEECSILMGDFNLLPKEAKDKKKLDTLCSDDKICSLNEVTRRMSNNQPDHILISKKIEKYVFTTSFFNFISDHNSIVIRIGKEKKTMRKEILEKINFSAEIHLKPSKKRNKTKETEKRIRKNLEEPINLPENLRVKFNRRILNPDVASCWLNACLQLILRAFDGMSNEMQLNSELGKELLKLHKMSGINSIDPSNVKAILAFAEDSRIAARKSEIMNEIFEQNELQRQLNLIDAVHLKLGTGQQCVRDFFLCLSENLETWIDVYQLFCVNFVFTTTCLSCGKVSCSEQNQLYLELDVPPNGSNLNEFVEVALNEPYKVEYNCQEGCKVKSEAENRTMIKSCMNVEYFIVILRRHVHCETGTMILENNVNSTLNIRIR